MVVVQIGIYLLYSVEEILYAEHIAVVGNGQSLHTEGFGSFDERRYGRCAVQDGILRMYV